MSPPHQSNIRNILLASFTSSDFERIASYLEQVDLPCSFVISVPNQVTDYVYFPETGIGSIVVRSPNGNRAEVCIFGREGMAPTAAVMGASSTPYSIFMQAAGTGYRIQNADLVSAYSQSIPLRNLLTRYVQAASVQIAYTAFSNAAHHIEQRLARWLLMCHDRTDGDTIAMTHEFLSIMLAVRRQSVTTTLHLLEGKHLVRSTRGAVNIINRKGLEALASDAYGPAEREYRKLVTGAL